jgi:putative SOS response-associated peptidase YedK
LPGVAGAEAAEPRQLEALLVPYPSEEMTCWLVSPHVGNVKNNDPSLIESLAAAE